jgi:hypothetical protein
MWALTPMGYPIGQSGKSTSGTMSDQKKTGHCQICGRILDKPADLLSENCGGDCWGCIGEIEADMGDTWALAKVRKEFVDGLRPGWIDPGDP